MVAIRIERMGQIQGVLRWDDKTDETGAVSESRSVMSDSATPWAVVHGILQARILEWVAFSFSRGSSQPRDRT